MFSKGPRQISLQSARSLQQIVCATLLTALASAGFTSNSFASDPMRTDIYPFEDHWTPDDSSSHFNDLFIASQILASVPVADGVVDFIQQANGSIGIVYEGQEAMQAIKRLQEIYHTTPLEIYLALDRTAERPPEALLIDHDNRVIVEPHRGSEPRMLAGFDDFPLKDANEMPVEDKPLSGSACVDGDLGHFEYAYKYHSFHNNGEHGDWAVGEHIGFADIVLPPTKAGVVAVCELDNKYQPEGYHALKNGLRLLVQVRVGSDTWTTIWQGGSPFTGAMYGYTFSGMTVQQIRMRLILAPTYYDQNAKLGRFFWAASI